ncbi:hypothetical protein BB558_004430 [Smittium angustum]|uniref:Uncharacterized protein n=1 Tax=Smittium angustum TaxID=133377 RepID=A0A2U1J353_SMIAN|nr:hypothetical protein BB558_004430 [Smittium angustum]
MYVVNQFLENLSVNYLGGMQVDQVSSAILMLLGYPLAHLFNLIPTTNPNSKHLFSIISSLSLMILVQELYAGAVHLLFDALVVYILIKTLKGRVSSVSKNQETGLVKYDHTGSHMIMVIKMTSLAFSINDGYADKESLTRYQQKHAIREIPSFIEYLGYLFFFPSFIAGPAFEMKTYRDMIQLDNKKVLNKRIGYGYLQMLYSFFWGYIFVKYSSVYMYKGMLKEDFKSYSMSYKILYMYLSGIVYRSLYYVAWRMCEGACIICGLGFSGYNDNQEPIFNDISNVHILKVEFPIYFKEVLNNWNIGTNTWLRNCFYVRLLPKGKNSSGKATLITFLVSAWWHGFYPGYYLSFILGGFMSNFSRITYRMFNPFYQNPNFLPGFRRVFQVAYIAFTSLLCIHMFSFAGAPFVLLDIKRSFEVWSMFYYFTPILVLFTIIYYDFMGGRRFFEKLHIKYKTPKDKSE